MGDTIRDLKTQLQHSQHQYDDTLAELQTLQRQMKSNPSSPPRAPTPTYTLPVTETTEVAISTDVWIAPTVDFAQTQGELDTIVELLSMSHDDMLSLSLLISRGYVRWREYLVRMGVDTVSNERSVTTPPSPDPRPVTSTAGRASSPPDV